MKSANPVTQEQINQNLINAKFNIGDQVKVIEKSCHTFDREATIIELLPERFTDIMCYRIRLNSEPFISFLVTDKPVLQEDYLERI